MRGVLFVIVVSLGLAVLALAYSFTPATLPVASSTGPTLPMTPMTPGPAGMKIAAIQAGAMFQRAAFEYRGGSFREQRVSSMGGVLVQHPKGTLLFDTGFGKQIDDHLKASPIWLRATTKYTKRTPIVTQLRAAGIDPTHIDGIVLSHAHWDHVSGIPDMPGVPAWVNAAELGYIHSRDFATGLIRSFDDLPFKVYDFPNGPYLGFEHSYDVYGDGSVVLVAAGGHTPGSVIAFLNLPSGQSYALIGDIVWQREGIEIPAERPWLLRALVDSDPGRVRELIVRLHLLQKRFPKLVMVPAHDARVWASLPQLEHAPPMLVKPPT
jgi:glyoxylase-like metal-dependent hydrolase (beta-lactamase superfamily II)